MKKVIVILAFAGLISACDPQDTYNDCRAGHNQGITDHTACVFSAIGHMWVPRTW